MVCNALAAAPADCSSANQSYPSCDHHIIKRAAPTKLSVLPQGAPSQELLRRGAAVSRTHAGRTVLGKPVCGACFTGCVPGSSAYPAPSVCYLDHLSHPAYSNAPLLSARLRATPVRTHMPPIPGPTMERPSPLPPPCQAPCRPAVPKPLSHHRPPALCCCTCALLPLLLH